MPIEEKTVVYISDAKVKALRDVGITNFSEFVRVKVDEYIAARGSPSKDTPDSTPVREAT